MCLYALLATQQIAKFAVGLFHVIVDKYSVSLPHHPGH
jgi:hypothetical protein